jgi:L-seryl-tRNA(Ser) seleniumtransferase
VRNVDGVTATVRQPKSIDNHSPGLAINWDAAKLGITGEEVSNILWTTEPRIALAGAGGGRGSRTNGAETGISITAYMMKPEDVQIVADRLYEVLSAKRPPWTPEVLQTPAADLSGRWDVQIQFAAGSGEHTLHLRQQGNQIAGTHQGEFTARDLTGTVSGDDVRLASSVGEVHGAALSYRFTGKLSGDTMSGNLDMGEYLSAKWTAKRHAFGRAQG